MIREGDIVFAQGRDARAMALMSRDLVEQGLGWRWTPQRIFAAIRDPDCNAVVVRNGNPIAGFGIMQYGFDDAHLLLLAVRPEFRRRKVGSRILRWLEETALLAGVARVQLESRLDNAGGRRFYRAHGYREEGILPGYYAGRESAIRMVRRLRP